jgi:hypothetical protein
MELMPDRIVASPSLADCAAEVKLLMERGEFGAGTRVLCISFDTSTHLQACFLKPTLFLDHRIVFGRGA